MAAQHRRSSARFGRLPLEPGTAGRGDFGVQLGAVRERAESHQGVASRVPLIPSGPARIVSLSSAEGQRLSPRGHQLLAGHQRRQADAGSAFSGVGCHRRARGQASACGWRGQRGQSGWGVGRVHQRFPGAVRSSGQRPWGVRARRAFQASDGKSSQWFERAASVCRTLALRSWCSVSGRSTPSIRSVNTLAITVA